MPPEREPDGPVGAYEVFEHLSGRPDLGAARPAPPGNPLFLASSWFYEDADPAFIP